MKRILASFLGILVCLPVLAHQPVMDMAPRWQGGYGFQLRHEWHQSDTLLNGDSEADNPSGEDKRVNTTWLEGIYTFKREVRLTVKLPYIDQSRTLSAGGREKDRGLGDIIIGVPLKRYSNFKDSTFNIGFTPSLRLPTGSTSSLFPAGDGSTDIGFSLSASLEKVNLYTFFDVFYWINNKGTQGIHEGDEIGFDGNIGIHPYHDNATNTGIFVMLDVTVRHQWKGERTLGRTIGGTRLLLGPILVYYRHGMMARAEVKLPVYERVEGNQVAFGPQLNIGVGFVF